jgi:hypothetical protein
MGRPSLLWAWPPRARAFVCVHVCGRRHATVEMRCLSGGRCGVVPSNSQPRNSPSAPLALLPPRRPPPTAHRPPPTAHRPTCRLTHPPPPPRRSLPSGFSATNPNFASLINGEHQAGASEVTVHSKAGQVCHSASLMTSLLHFCVTSLLHYFMRGQGSRSLT